MEYLSKFYIFNRKIVWLLPFFAIISVLCQDEFPHLIKLANKTKQIHLNYDLIRNEDRLRVDEYVDLENWQQVIQFSWYDYQASATNRLRVHKETVNIINDDQQFRKLIYNYRPYTCNLRLLYESDDEMYDKTAWISQLEASDPGNRMQRLHTIINSFVSTSLDSPYFSRVPLVDTNQKAKEAWIFGLSGVWLKAQNLTGDISSLSLTNTDDEAQQDRWSLRLNYTRLSVDFEFLIRRNNRQVAMYEAPVVAEISQDSRLIDTILTNDDSLSLTSMDRKYFQLPLGYDCPSNLVASSRYSSLSKSFMYLRNTIIENEFTAMNYRHDQASRQFPVSYTKIVTIARVAHPMDASALLSLYRVHDDESAEIHDSFHGLVIDQRGSSCYFTKLDSNSHFRVLFPNGLALSLGEYELTQLVNRNENLRLINVDTSKNNSERFYYESSSLAPSDIISMEEHMGFDSSDASLSLIKVFEKKSRRNLELKSISMMLFNRAKDQLYAEIRMNILDSNGLFSALKISELLNFGACRDKEPSLRIVASYPVDPKLAQLAQDHGLKLIESFYDSFYVWKHLAMSGSTLNDIDESERKARLEKHKLGLSLNVLRLWDVRLVSLSQMDRIELHFRLFDKLSPAQTFHRLEAKSFQLNPKDQRLMVETLSDCAHLCLISGCFLFAYDQSRRECRIGHTLNRTQLIDELNSRQSQVLVDKSPSTLYYQDRVKQSELEEARLTDFVSYFDHHDSSRDNEGQDYQTQHLATPLDFYPLFSFRFNPYSLEAPRILVPERVSIFEEQGKYHQFDLVTLSNQFQLSEIDKNFIFPTNDIWVARNDRDHRYLEDSFSNRYIMSRFKNVDMTSCSELCLDIDEIDFDSGQGLSCISFTSCPTLLTCILVLQVNGTSGKGFNGISWPSNDREIVKIESLQSLVSTKSACLIASRNHLSDFEPPIEIDRNTSLPDSTQIELSFVELAGHSEQSKREEICASNCLSRDQQGTLCLAIDLCPNQASCRLVEARWSPNKLENSTLAHEFNHVTNMLARQLVDSDYEGDNHNNCRRHLISHASQFKPLSQRKLTDTFKGSLEGRISILEAINLHACIEQCYTRFQECMMFEHCVTKSENSGLLRETCSLFLFPADVVANNQFRGLKRTIGDNSTTEYEPNCRIYARKLINLNKFKEYDYTVLIVAFLTVYVSLATVVFVRWLIERNRKRWVRQQQASLSLQINHQVRAYEMTNIRTER